MGAEGLPYGVKGDRKIYSLNIRQHLWCTVCMWEARRGPGGSGGGQWKDGVLGGRSNELGDHRQITIEMMVGEY